MKLTNNTDFFQKKGTEVKGQTLDNSTSVRQQEANHVEKRQRKSSAEISALIKQTTDVLDTGRCPSE